MPLFRASSASSQATTASRSSNRPSASNNPFADGNSVANDLQGLNFGGADAAPPPPSYQTALRSSLTGEPITAPQQPASPRQQPPLQHQQSSPQRGPPHPPPSSASQASPRNSIASTASVQRRTSVESPLAALGKFDVIVLVDDSPSMSEGSRWDETREALMGVAAECVKYDSDGIQINFMNNDTCHLQHVTDISTVRESFETIEPFGSTPTAIALDEILRDYVDSVEDARQAKAKVKPLIVLILTDGRADDPDGLKELLLEMAGRLDAVKAPPHQLGVQLIQVGSDPDAAAFLQELDDDLKAEGVRDMVDTTPYEGAITPAFVLKAALGSVVKRLDNSS